MAACNTQPGILEELENFLKWGRVLREMAMRSKTLAVTDRTTEQGEMNNYHWHLGPCT